MKAELLDDAGNFHGWRIAGSLEVEDGSKSWTESYVCLHICTRYDDDAAGDGDDGDDDDVDDDDDDDEEWYGTCDKEFRGLLLISCLSYLKPYKVDPREQAAKPKPKAANPKAPSRMQGP